MKFKIKSVGKTEFLDLSYLEWLSITKKRS